MGQQEFDPVRKHSARRVTDRLDRERDQRWPMQSALRLPR